MSASHRRRRSRSAAVGRLSGTHRRARLRGDRHGRIAEGGRLVPRPERQVGSGRSGSPSAPTCRCWTGSSSPPSAVPGKSYRWYVNGKLYKQVLAPGLTPTSAEKSHDGPESAVQHPALRASLADPVRVQGHVTDQRRDRARRPLVAVGARVATSRRSAPWRATTRFKRGCRCLGGST